MSNTLLFKGGPMSAPKYRLPKPASITDGLRAHYVADDIGVADGAPLATTASWVSRVSTTGILALAPHSTAAGRIPTKEANVANGHAGVRFTAANNQGLVRNFGSGYVMNAPVTRVVVGKADNEGVFVTGNGTSYLSIKRGPNGGVQAGAGASQAEASTLATVDQPGPLFDANIHMIAVCTYGDQSWICVDNVFWPVTLGVSAPAAARLTAHRMGSNPGGTGNWLNGVLLEARDYDRPLSRLDMALLWSTVKATYGLS